MGSPLPGILAEIFLNKIENDYIMNENNQFNKNYIAYYLT